MLLTPKKLDEVRNRSKFVLGTWRGESETTQLEDCAFALNLFRDRTFKVVIGGTEVWIRPDISFMNLGVNAEAARIGPKGALPPSNIQEMVNARGFREFEEESSKWLDGRLKILKDKTLTDFVKLFESIWKEPAGNWKEPVKKAQERIDQAKALHQTEWESSCKEFLKLSEKYLTATDKTLKSRLKERMQTLNFRINEMQRELTAAFEDLQKAKETIYHENRELLRELPDKIKARYSVILNQTSAPNRLTMLTKMRDFHLNYLQAVDLYYSKKYENPETLTAFQAIYLEQMFMMNLEPEFFCKSAEDRTGRINNVVEEREIYRSQTGHYPASKYDQDEIDAKIAPAVHQFSATSETRKRIVRLQDCRSDSRLILRRLILTLAD